MKKDQKIELRTKTADELIKELIDLRHEVAKLSIDMQTGKIEDTNKLYKKKKDIARVLTFLSQAKHMGEVSLSVSERKASSEKPKAEVKEEKA